jgi:hypothetical protein
MIRLPMAPPSPSRPHGRRFEADPSDAPETANESRCFSHSTVILRMTVALLKGRDKQGTAMKGIEGMEGITGTHSFHSFDSFHRSFQLSNTTDDSAWQGPLGVAPQTKS